MTPATVDPAASARPRITPGTRRDVGAVNWAISAVAGRVSGTNPPNLFLTLGRRRRLLRGWLFFAGRLMPGGTLPRRETELVILRVAHLRGCAYEFDHHVRLGARAGVDATDVERLTRTPSNFVGESAGSGPLTYEVPLGEGWSAREAVVLAAVDELHHHQDLADATWSLLRDHLSEPEAIELLMLVGHYEMLATTILTLRIQPDRHRG